MSRIRKLNQSESKLNKLENMPRCKNPDCKDKFIPKYFLQKHCMEKDECIRLEIEHKKETIWKDKRDKNNKEVRELREQFKGLPEYKKDFEEVINEIVRLIDKGCLCISCNKPGNSAGHFHSVGSNGSLRYNLHNLHLQEWSCNGNKGGNIVKYGQGLTTIYGKEYKEYIEYDLVRLYPVLRLSVQSLKEAIKLGRTVIKHLKLENKTYQPQERKELRTKYNNLIGIYQ